MVALSFAAVPAFAGGKKARTDGRSKVTAQQTKSHRVNAKSGNEGRKERADRKKDRKLADLGSLVATVEGVSVAPATGTSVTDVRLHRPADTDTTNAQAAGSTAPAPPAGRGMLDFLVVALLLSSLAAWLVRQVGPLRN